MQYQMPTKERQAEMLHSITGILKELAKQKIDFSQEDLIIQVYQANIFKNDPEFLVAGAMIAFVFEEIQKQLVVKKLIEDVKKNAVDHELHHHHTHVEREEKN